MKQDAPVILYIEDNIDNRKLVSRVLKAAGYRVFGAGDGYAGINLAEEQLPDLILVDIQLPTIDGYAVMSELRKRERLADIPIVALTANVMKDDREKSFAAGSDGFIQKPIDVDRLPAQIQAYLTASAQGKRE